MSEFAAFSVIQQVPRHAGASVNTENGNGKDSLNGPAERDLYFKLSLIWRLN